MKNQADLYNSLTINSLLQKLSKSKLRGYAEMTRILNQLYADECIWCGRNIVKWAYEDGSAGKLDAFGLEI